LPPKRLGECTVIEDERVIFCTRVSVHNSARKIGLVRCVDREVPFVARRYDSLAALIPLFDWLFCCPPHLRDLAAARLNVQPGARVLEIGCGSGRNFPALQRVVGPAGRIYRVDVSAGMLARARTLCKRKAWANVELTRCDAAEYIAAEPLDGILFGLSYNTMAHHRMVLQHAWHMLRPGGRIVIMDAKPPPGRLGDIFLPVGAWLMKHTLLGNPYIRPWVHLSELAQDFAMEEFVFGSWYVCWGMKPVRAAAEQRDYLELRAAE
jgi:ubiquinone/menaquinone biosynthesis C-methylase UbiE